MAGVSAEQHLFSGSIFSDCCSPPCQTLEPPKEQSPPKFEHESSSHLFPCANLGNSSSIPAQEAASASARKLLAKSLSFGGIDSTRSRAFGVSFPDDLSALKSDGFPPENFLCAIKQNSPSLVGSFSSGSAFESADAIAALQKFLPSNNEEEASWPAVDVFSCDEFRMYEFKVRKCTRGRSHDWTECPFAHPGEKARRRDPRRFHYSGTGCPDFRKGSCRRGDACEFAHGVFECWLHPARYRTQPCKDGRGCRRRVCFFAHTPEQLRLLPGNLQAPNLNLGHRNFAIGGSYDGSPLRSAISATSFDGFGYDLGTGTLMESKCVSPRQLRSCLYKPKANMVQISSPTSTLVGLSQSPPSSPSGSPPLSPDGSPCWMTYGSSSPANEAAAYQNSAIQTKVGGSINNNSVAASSFVGYHRPLNVAARRENIMSASFISVPNVDGASPEATVGDYGDLIKSLQLIDLNASLLWQQQQQNNPSPGKSLTATSYNQFSHCAMNVPCARWDGWGSSAEDGMPRVESGRDLRAKIYGRLSKDLSPLQDTHNVAECPDLAWVNELVM